MKTPVAIFTYNRPNYTEDVLYSVSRCLRLQECQIFIYCDAPKREEHAESVVASQQVVSKWREALRAEVVIRDENFGLARTTISAVTELCSMFGRVVVLEDDLTVNSRFLDYMIQSLDKFEEAEKVYQISGYMFPVSHPADMDAWLIPLTTTVGWGTWDRAWRHFEPDPKDWRRDLENRDFRRRLDMDGAYTFSSMLRDRMEGRNHSWGVLWYYTLVKAGALALHPRKTLVWVGGFDNTGVHCGGVSPLYAHDKEEVLSHSFNNELRLPGAIMADAAAFGRVKAFLKSHQPGRIRRAASVMKTQALRVMGRCKCIGES